jgi:hypothetical protein
MYPNVITKRMKKLGHTALKKKKTPRFKSAW